MHDASVLGIDRSRACWIGLYVPIGPRGDYIRRLGVSLNLAATKTRYHPLLTPLGMFEPNSPVTLDNHILTR